MRTERDPLITGLGEGQRRTIQALRSQGRFFWLDLLVDGEQLEEAQAREQLTAALGVPEHALRVLFDFESGTPLLRKYHADGEHVVFAFHSITHPNAPFDAGARAIRAVEVHVLVHGDYLLTVHEKPAQLQPPPEESPPAERGEKYLVFFALFEMTITLFEALNHLSEGLQELESGSRNPATELKTIRRLRARLTEVRRIAGRQTVLFSHVAEEIERVRGLGGTESSQYFARIESQLARLVSGIDATGQALAALVDQGMNTIMFRLTVVATIFLPLTVITGFFGMNFDWLLKNIGGKSDFLVYGVGSLALAIMIALIVMRREVPVLVRGDEG